MVEYRKEVEPIKVVVRYTDGRVLKGYTKDFFPNKPFFRLRPAGTEYKGEGLEVLIKDLKAVFFVSDFEGNPPYTERKQFGEGERPPGRKVEVTFVDGEVLVGSNLGYDRHRPGFFLFPVDPQSNNLRVFVVVSAVSNVRFL